MEGRVTDGWKAEEDGQRGTTCLSNAGVFIIRVRAAKGCKDKESITHIKREGGRRGEKQ